MLWPSTAPWRGAPRRRHPRGTDRHPGRGRHGQAKKAGDHRGTDAPRDAHLGGSGRPPACSRICSARQDTPCRPECRPPRSSAKPDARRACDWRAATSSPVRCVSWPSGCVPTWSFLTGPGSSAARSAGGCHPADQPEARVRCGDVAETTDYSLTAWSSPSGRSARTRSWRVEHSAARDLRSSMAMNTTSFWLPSPLLHHDTGIRTDSQLDAMKRTYRKLVFKDDALPSGRSRRERRGGHPAQYHPHPPCLYRAPRSARRGGDHLGPHPPRQPVGGHGRPPTMSNRHPRDDTPSMPLPIARLSMSRAPSGLVRPSDPR